MSKSKHIHISKSDRTLVTTFYIMLSLITLVALFPFALMITSSFMNENEIAREGFKLIPQEWSIAAYETLLRNPAKLLNSYQVTITITLVGTSVGLLIMSMAGYVLNRKDFAYRNGFSFFIYFTTLFSGGLVPTYILYVRQLGLRDNILALIFPGLASAWSIFLMRNFLKSIPDSLYESATIDGAGDFRIYWQIFMPLSVPALATVGLFTAIGYWNEWYNAMLYISRDTLVPLQYYLQRMINQTNIQQLLAQGVAIDTSRLPTQSIKMAVAVLATGPVILFYPFVQRYFVSGLTVGAVKG